MTKHGTARDLGNGKIRQAPGELKSLIALNTALKAARDSEQSREYIASAQAVRLEADHLNGKP